MIYNTEDFEILICKLIHNDSKKIDLCIKKFINVVLHQNKLSIIKKSSIC